MVNREPEAIESGVPAAIGVLRPGGVLCVITYQSEEDRQVKELLKRAARGCRCDLPPDECRCSFRPEVEWVHRKVIKPGPEELGRNRRARSAKLRVVRKLGRVDR